MKKWRLRGRELTLVLIFFSYSLFIGCATTALPPIDQQRQGLQLAEDERKIWEKSRKFERMMFEKGMLYYDPSFEDYLNEVGQKLVPENVKGTGVNFKFSVIRNPTLNAFAFPNGSIYVHTGLLARLENEAPFSGIIWLAIRI